MSQHTLPFCICVAGGRLLVTGDGFEMRAVDAARGLMELHERLAVPLCLFAPGAGHPHVLGACLICKPGDMMLHEGAFQAGAVEKGPHLGGRA